MVALDDERLLLLDLLFKFTLFSLDVLEHNIFGLLLQNILFVDLSFLHHIALAVGFVLGVIFESELGLCNLVVELPHLSI